MRHGYFEPDASLIIDLFTISTSREKPVAIFSSGPIGTGSAHYRNAFCCRAHGLIVAVALAFDDFWLFASFYCTDRPTTSRMPKKGVHGAVATATIGTKTVNT